MIQQRMNEWILHPESLNADSLQELRAVLQRYPYYQTAWVLYLKNLFLLHDETFPSELRRGALYVADLSVLFYYIEGDKFVIQKHEVEHPSAETTDRTLDLIERFLSESPEISQTPKGIPIGMEVNLDYTSVLLKADDTAEETETPLLRGQDLIDSFIARESTGKVPAGEVLSEEMQEQPVSETAVPSKDSTDSSSLMIQDASDDMDENESETDIPVEENEDESYFTETLAKIYIKQQRYDKALEIIKKLNLKYPKKNIYFADQIRFLEKLIINAKSK